MNHSTLNISCESDFTYQWNWSYITDPVIILALVSSLCWLFSRYKHNLEPVHLLELNTLLDLNIQMFVKGFDNFDHLFLNDKETICVGVHIVKLWARQSFLLDFSACQLDKFLALKWNIGYKEKVTNSLTLKVLSMIKVLAFLISIIISIIDPDFFMCSESKMFICSHYKPSNFFWITIPTFLCIFITFAVGVYVFRIAKKFSNTRVQPINVVNNPKPSKDPSIPLKTMKESLSITETGSNFEQETIKRTTDHPYIFVRVPQQQPDPTLIRTISNNQALDRKISLVNNLLEMATSAVKFNIISLFSLGLMCPEAVINIIVFTTNISCDNSKNFIFWAKIVGLVQISFIVSLPFLVKRKLDHFK